MKGVLLVLELLKNGKERRCEGVAIIRPACRKKSALRK